MFTRPSYRNLSESRTLSASSSTALNSQRTAQNGNAPGNWGYVSHKDLGIPLLELSEWKSKYDDYYRKLHQTQKQKKIESERYFGRSSHQIFFFPPNPKIKKQPNKPTPINSQTNNDNNTVGFSAQTERLKSYTRLKSTKHKLESLIFPQTHDERKRPKTSWKTINFTHRIKASDLHDLDDLPIKSDSQCLSKCRRCLSCDFIINHDDIDNHSQNEIKERDQKTDQLRTSESNHNNGHGCESDDQSIMLLNENKEMLSHVRELCQTCRSVPADYKHFLKRHDFIKYLRDRIKQDEQSDQTCKKQMINSHKSESHWRLIKRQLQRMELEVMSGQKSLEQLESFENKLVQEFDHYIGGFEQWYDEMEYQHGIPEDALKDRFYYNGWNNGLTNNENLWNNIDRLDKSQLDYVYNPRLMSKTIQVLSEKISDEYAQQKIQDDQKHHQREQIRHVFHQQMKRNRQGYHHYSNETMNGIMSEFEQSSNIKRNESGDSVKFRSQSSSRFGISKKPYKTSARTRELSTPRIRRNRLDLMTLEHLNFQGVYVRNQENHHRDENEEEEEEDHHHECQERNIKYYTNSEQSMNVSRDGDTNGGYSSSIARNSSEKSMYTARTMTDCHCQSERTKEAEEREADEQTGNRVIKVAQSSSQLSLQIPDTHRERESTVDSTEQVVHYLEKKPEPLSEAEKQKKETFSELDEFMVHLETRKKHDSLSGDTFDTLQSYL